MRYLVTMMAALTLASAAGLYVNIEQTEATPDYKVGVWYPGWGTEGDSDYEMVSRNVGTIDEINPYWYAMKSDGSVSAYEWAEDPKLIKLAREHDKPLMPLVTNEFDPARVSRMLATKSSREAHATRLVNLTVDKRYDGLDLDYEMLYAKDRDRFSLFVERLASKLHARGKKLSVTVHPKTSESGNWSGPDAQDWTRLGKAADTFKIMTYDYSWDGSEAGPAAPLTWIDKVLSFAETKVSPSKIRMGLPFYGRDWEGTRAKDLVHAEVRALINEHSPTVRRHASGEPYFTYKDGRTVYYQDPTSIGRKLDVLTKKHPRIGGIVIWHVGGEPPRNWEVIRDKL